MKYVIRINDKLAVTFMDNDLPSYIKAYFLLQDMPIKGYNFSEYWKLLNDIQTTEKTDWTATKYDTEIVIVGEYHNGGVDNEQ